MASETGARSECAGDPQTDPLIDLRWMRGAFALARRGLGNVWPNPAVGCVIVSHGRVVGRGWTQPGGRPHAETEALRRARAAARGAAAYVSLEPCSHWGKTPPCADALIAAGVRRVVVALEDPDPRVSGAGIRRLRGAGVAVEAGLGAEEAAEINAGFLIRQRLGRPARAIGSPARRRAPMPTDCAPSTTRSWPVLGPCSPTIRSSPAACPGSPIARRCGWSWTAICRSRQPRT
jgi:pyrimidine deaminase RibD-like protein